ncbi:MAG: histidine ammonia-lyase [Chloroflexi bacterium]|nr:histidine ammonia-lyase [Chloroflexota bacterium]
MLTGTQTIELDGERLTLEQVVAAARGAEGGRPIVRLAAGARERLTATREYIEDRWLSDDAPAIYGFNTGVGPLKEKRIPVAENQRFQAFILSSHSAGVGPPLPEDAVRATMLLRVNALAKNCSGIRPVVLDRLLDMLNRGVHPVIPEIGSVGASGDLAPLAHLAAAMVGHPRAEAFYQGRRLPAPTALQAAGIAPATFTLEAKDALALVNGSTMTLGIGVLALADAWEIARNADVALALTLEAVRGEPAAFDHRIQAARNHPGQVAAAANVRALIRGSARTTEAARAVRFPEEARSGDGPPPPRVQDAYSIRCAPQVHGAARDVLTFVGQVLEREANAATDNPLVFPDGNGGYEMLSGGNFHGEPLAFALDFLAMAVAELGNISERRSFRLLEPTLSFGVPGNLVGATPGVNTGFALVQCAASAIVNEMKTLAMPASTDSIPTKRNQEDHVSMSTWSSRKARQVVERCRQVIGVEYFCASQALALVEPLMAAFPLGAGTAAACGAIRRRIPPVGEDRWMHDDMVAAEQLVATGEVLGAAQAAVGPLG